VTKSLIPAVGLLLSLVPLSLAQSPAPRPTGNADVEKWIGQLGDADYRKRDEAAQALQRLGEKALPALRAARKHGDPEIRRRAHELASAVETATLLAPKHVTLQIKGKTARDAVAELAKVTGYKIECWGNIDNTAYDFTWKDVPFWQAADDLCRAAGLTIQPSYGDDRLRLQAQQRSAPYVVREGAFRATASGFQHLRSVDFAAISAAKPEPRRTDSLTFNFTVYSEPRLPLLNVGEVKLTAAYDDEGNSMVPPAAPAADPADGPVAVTRTSRYYGGKTLSIPTDVALARPSPRARTARLIRVSLPVTVLVEQRPEVVTDKLAKGQKVKVGSTTFAIEDISETANKQPQIKMSITEENAGTDFTWTNSLYNRLEVYDEKGVRMQNRSSSWTHASPNHVQITFMYGNGSKPTKLVYHVWNSLQHQVSFEFKDLPLP
jgi:hypothetical protein